MGVVAHDPVKQAYGSVFTVLDSGEERLGIDRLALQAGMRRGKRQHWLRQTSAHRRQQSNFIPSASTVVDDAKH